MVIILGETGRNFAAGMSGGIAYVYDPRGEFTEKCNLEMVALETLQKDDETLIRKLLLNHLDSTSSTVAECILEDFTREKRRFVKVMPIEYKRVLMEKAMNEDIKTLQGFKSDFKKVFCPACGDKNSHFIFEKYG